MSDVQIIPESTNLHPREVLRGQVIWQLETSPTWIELRLFWFTRGKGTMDLTQVDQQRFETPPAGSNRNFQFTLPDQPYSYSGRLIAIVWGLELVVHNGPTGRVELVMSPTGQEIVPVASMT